MMSGLLFGVVLSVFACWSHDTLTLTTWLAYVDFRSWSYECSFFSFSPVSLYMSECSRTRTVISLYVLFFCQYRSCWYNVVSFFRHIVDMACMCCFCDCNIFILWCLLCNPWSCALRLFVIIIILILFYQDFVPKYFRFTTCIFEEVVCANRW